MCVFKNIISSVSQNYSGILAFFFLAHSFINYEPIFMKNSMNANIVKTLIYHKIVYDLFLRYVNENGNELRST